MKSVFNIESTPASPRARRVLAGLGALALLLALPAVARSEVLYTVRALLGEVFRTSTRVTYVRVQPSDHQRARLEERLGRKLAQPRYTFNVALSGDRVDGFALMDKELGQHEEIDFATFFDSQGRVTRVEVLAYRERYGEGIRAERFRRQFVGRDARSGFRIGTDIDGISGATISARSMARAVQRATVLLDEMVLAKERTQASR